MHNKNSSQDEQHISWNKNLRTFRRQPIAINFTANPIFQIPSSSSFQRQISKSLRFLQSFSINSEKALIRGFRRNKSTVCEITHFCKFLRLSWRNGCDSLTWTAVQYCTRSEQSLMLDTDCKKVDCPKKQDILGKIKNNPKNSFLSINGNIR